MFSPEVFWTLRSAILKNACKQQYIKSLPALGNNTETKIQRQKFLATGGGIGRVCKANIPIHFLAKN